MIRASYENFLTLPPQPINNEASLITEKFFSRGVKGGWSYFFYFRSCQKVPSAWKKIEKNLSYILPETFIIYERRGGDFDLSLPM